MILPNDILIRDTSDGPTVWVSQRLVVECCGVSEEYIRKIRVLYKHSLPASWQKVSEQDEFFLGYKAGKSWRWGRRGGQYYYDIDTIPNRRPTFFRDRLPSKEELLDEVDSNRLRGSRERQMRLESALSDRAKGYRNEEDARWLQSASDVPINLTTCRDYAKALGWCRFIDDVRRREAYDEVGCVGMQDFMTRCAEAISRQHIANLRVTTGESLRQKLRGFPAEEENQRRWIISGKFGNDNRKIVGKYRIVDRLTGEIMEFDIHQAVMFSCYMNVGDPRKEYKDTLYNEVYVPTMEAFGERPVALRTFNAHLGNFAARLKTDLHRHGESYYKKHLQTYIPSERQACSHSLFCGDGSGLIAYRYWKKTRDANGKEKKELRIMNTYAVLVSDVSSGCIVGYAFAPEGTHEETPSMVQQAVRMAVQNGECQTMFEFVSDGYGAFTMASQKQFLRSVFNVVRNIEPSNSQANPAEAQFRLFKNATLRRFSSFIRSSHNAGSIESRANLDGMVKGDYPLYDEAVSQTIAAITAWNNTPRGNGLTPAEMFRDNKHPQCKPMDAIQLRNIFGHHTKVEVTRMRGFVEVSHAGERHLFTIPDYHDSGIRKIAKTTGNGYDAEVQVVWDATGADLYSLDGKFILSCLPTLKANQSYIERTDAQREAQLYLGGRKDDQMESARKFAEDVSRTLDVATMTNDYDVPITEDYETSVRFGGGKESTNEAFENELNDLIPSKSKNNNKNGSGDKAPAADISRAVYDRYVYGA